MTDPSPEVAAGTAQEVDSLPVWTVDVIDCFMRWKATLKDEAFTHDEGARFVQMLREFSGDDSVSQPSAGTAQEPRWQQLRATLVKWGEEFVLRPQMMVKTPFETIQRVVLEMDRLAALPSAPAPPQTNKDDAEA
jgi:hypothetical protein